MRIYNSDMLSSAEGILAAETLTDSCYTENVSTTTLVDGCVGMLSYFTYNLKQLVQKVYETSI